METDTTTTEGAEGTDGTDGTTFTDGGGDKPGIFSDGFKFSEGWADQLGDDATPYRAMASQFKDLPSMLKSMHDTKSALSQRQEGMIKKPGAEASPDELKAWNDAIGVPDSPDDYEFQTPENLPEGVEFSEADLGAFKEFAHKSGISNEQANALIQFQAEVEGAQLAAYNQEAQAEMEAAQKDLQNEWGNAWQQKQMMAKRAAETFGLGADNPAMENPDVIKTMAKIAESISEDKLVSGESLGGSLNAGSQAKDISGNPDNALYSAYWDSTHPQHDHAVKTYQGLQEEQARREGLI